MDKKQRWKRKIQSDCPMCDPDSEAVVLKGDGMGICTHNIIQFYHADDKT